MTHSAKDVRRIVHGSFVVHRPSTYGWFHTFFRQEVRHVCPLEGHCSCTEKKEANWDRLLASKEEPSVSWFPDGKKEESGFLFYAEDFQMFR